MVEIQNKSQVRKNQPLVYAVYSIRTNRNRCENIILFWKPAIALLVLSVSNEPWVKSVLEQTACPLQFPDLHSAFTCGRCTVQISSSSTSWVWGLSLPATRAITLPVLGQPGSGVTPHMYVSWMMCSAALGAERLFVSIHSSASGAGSLIAQLVLAE